jgi:inosose dehydratase
LLLGRGEPITAIRDWGARINQVHLKDARLARLEEIVARAAPVEEIWRRQAFCALGDGDIDIMGVLDALGEIGYSGWLVVEQDVLPDPENPGQPARDQRRNREYLRAHGL